MKMKLIGFTLMVQIFALSCESPERNCTDFKTGTFTYEELLDGELVATTFTRNDTLEVDYFQGKADTSSVRWINDCEYIAKKLNPRSMSDEKALHFKILTTDGDFYTFEYSFVGKTTKQRGTAKKTTN